MRRTAAMHAADDFTSPSLGVIDVARAYDALSDDELAAQHILAPSPVTHPRNIWSFWHAGWAAMPRWRQRVCIDWVRRQGPGWQLRVLDTVEGSPWNAVAYLGKEAFCTSALNGDLVRDDPGAQQHVSDFVRLAALVRYGGVWLDADMAMQRNLEDICWGEISDEEDATQVVIVAPMNRLGPNIILGSFIAARAGNVFLEYWMKVHLFLWEGKTSPAGFDQHALLWNFPQLEVPPLWTANFGAELTAERLNSYIAFSLVASRLINIRDEGAGWDGPAYWKKHVRVLDLLELFPLAHLYYGDDGYTEPRQWELLCRPRALDPVQRALDPEQRDAERLCEAMVGQSSFQKRPNAIHSLPTVAKLWTDHPGSDIAPGSWAEYCRWARVHADQTARRVKLWTPGEPGFLGLGKCWITGLCTPVTDKTVCIDVEP